MSAKKFWCNVCKKLVEVTIDEGTSALIAPAIGGTVGGAIGKAKGGWGGALFGIIAGAVVGTVVHETIVPKAQRLICGECGGSSLSASGEPTCD